MILLFSQDEPPADNIGLFWSAFKSSYLLNHDIFHATGLSIIAATVFSLKTEFKEKEKIFSCTGSLKIQLVAEANLGRI